MQLNKSVALITGGAQGLGRLFAQNLLKRGTKVVVADLNIDAGYLLEEQSATEFGKNTLNFLECDVSKKKELNAVFEEAISTYGRLDIICNNAGIMTTLENQPRIQVDINLTAVIEGTYKGIELMSKQKGGDGGVIVNVGSAAGIDLVMNAAVFSATKHAVIAFSRSFKRSTTFSEHGVRVNCICPYFVKTQMLKAALDENPGNIKVVKTFGIVDSKYVSEGFMRCIESEGMNGAVLVVSPNNKIFEMEFDLEQ